MAIPRSPSRIYTFLCSLGLDSDLSSFLTNFLSLLSLTILQYSKVFLGRRGGVFVPCSFLSFVYYGVMSKRCFRLQTSRKRNINQFVCGCANTVGPPCPMGLDTTRILWYSKKVVFNLKMVADFQILTIGFLG